MFVFRYWDTPNGFKKLPESEGETMLRSKWCVSHVVFIPNSTSTNATSLGGNNPNFKFCETCYYFFNDFETTFLQPLFFLLMTLEFFFNTLYVLT
jgi:hypothetical protein